MTDYDLESAHKAVGDSYSMAKNIDDNELKDEVISGIVRMAQQVRAAEERDKAKLFELGDALDYGAEGMTRIAEYDHRKMQEVQEHQEQLMPLMFGENNVLQQGENLAQAADAAKASAGMTEPPLKPEEIEEGINNLKDIQQKFEYAEKAARDAAASGMIAQDMANAYESSLEALTEYDALERRVESRIQEGNSNFEVASSVMNKF